MAKKIDVSELASEINSIMQDFVEATEETVDEAVKTASKHAVQQLRNANPPGSGQYSPWSKEYNKSWKVMQTKSDKRYHRKATIYNEKHYRLTHLLEKGHALVNGGRTRAFPHIAQVDEKAQEELMDLIKRGI